MQYHSKLSTTFRTQNLGLKLFTRAKPVGPVYIAVRWTGQWTLRCFINTPKSEKVKKLDWGRGGLGSPGEFEGSLLFSVIFPASTKDGFLIIEGQLPLKQCPELAQYPQGLQMDQG